MMADSFRCVEAAAEWAGLALSSEITERLTIYHEWLQTEAIKAGGLGPNEQERIWSRHIADSMLFGLAVTKAQTCVDVGSGVGLPGLPLAVVRSDVSFDLVDRSGRRADLLRRIITVLGLGNCRVIHGDIKAVDNLYGAVVSRASLPPDRLMIHVKHLLEAGGVGIIGLSRKDAEAKMPACPPGLECDVLAVPDNILDTAVSLLRIVAT